MCQTRALAAPEAAATAQIAAEDTRVEADELLVDGAVEPETLARRLDLGRRGVEDRQH
jgi:hypothetical protein